LQSKPGGNDSLPPTTLTLDSLPANLNSYVRGAMDLAEEQLGVQHKFVREFEMKCASID
jgi:hypothetical protein